MSLQGKGILQPLDPDLAASCLVDADDIEARFSVGMRRPPAQKKFGRPTEFPLLELIDGLGSGHEAIFGPVTHFHEDEAIGIQHDEIDLSETTAVVAFDAAQASRLEIAQGECFCTVS